jgi:hypothetical protein
MFASVCAWVFCNVTLFYMFVGVSFFFRIKLHCFIELIEKTHLYIKYIEVYRRWGARFYYKQWQKLSTRGKLQRKRELSFLLRLQFVLEVIDLIPNLTQHNKIVLRIYCCTLLKDLAFCHLLKIHG